LSVDHFALPLCGHQYERVFALQVAVRVGCILAG
jgi:hypothetical protein